MEFEEKRIGKNPIPEDPLEYLNAAQLFTYHRITGLGWHIKFVRRPMYESPTLFMTDSDESLLAVIEDNGYFNLHSDIPLRTTEGSSKA
jgi:hypothetical protein